MTGGIQLANALSTSLRLVPPRRLLVRGVNWLGDAVMTMPALCRLREAFPEAHITLLTFPKLADIYRMLPAIDSVMTLNRDESPFKVAARLRAENFDTGLILPNSVRTALPFWLAGIPRRVGYGGRGRTLLLTQPVQRGQGIVRIQKRPLAEIGRLTGLSVSNNATPVLKLPLPRLRVSSRISSRIFSLATADLHPTPDLHHLHAYLQLVSALGAESTLTAPQMVVPEVLCEALRERLQIPASPDRPLFGLNPGAEYGLAKRWPEERFIETAIELHRRFHCRWLVLGGPADRELSTRIADGIEKGIGTGTNGTGIEKNQNMVSGTQSVWNVAGQTSLTELCAALRLCDLVLTNDTGPMHVAAAVGTRVVVPFGSTSAALTGPGMPADPRHRLLQSNAVCAPCFHRVCPIDFRCMEGISVAHVVSAVSEIYA